MAALPREVVRGAASSVHRGTPARAIKRSLDVGLGLGIALLALPLMVSIAIAIRLDSPGPVLYRPKRVGLGGTVFSMYKFRTMVDGAEAKLSELAHLNIASGMVKIPGDPRVTRVGSWLRRFSLDELPQLFNVMAGHMSLVGPRPHDQSELAGLDLEHDPWFEMRPGITGLWQVKARTDPSLERRRQLAHEYVTNWSLGKDFQILALTVPAVLAGRGGTVAQKTDAEPMRGLGGVGDLEPQLAGMEAIQAIVGWPLTEPQE